MLFQLMIITAKSRKLIIVDELIQKTSKTRIVSLEISQNSKQIMFFMLKLDLKSEKNVK